MLGGEERSSIDISRAKRVLGAVIVSHTLLPRGALVLGGTTTLCVGDRDEGLDCILGVFATGKCLSREKDNFPRL